MSSTLILPGDPQPLTHGLEIQERLENAVDAVLDGGDCGVEPTTVVDLSSSPPVIVREGKGSLEPLIGDRR
jgi:tRNA A37 threonylcarbamoyladenosine synthetase subunit TsaC/SUA5/YrdC